MKKLTIAQKENYIESPNHCPYCGSDNIDARGLDQDNNVATQSVHCDDCFKSWSDVYTLTGIYED